jgi:hypothetical protein
MACSHQARDSGAPTRLVPCTQALRLASAVLVTSLGWVMGCGPVEESSSEPLAPASQLRGLESPNGLSANGLSANGLSANGLSANGLSVNGVYPESFKAWFQSDRALANAVMRYLIHCAVPSGQTRSYTDDVTGETYTWSGGLGLAPDWASGKPATVTEQQIISACLAAHVNRYGVHIPISVLGLDARGRIIPYTAEELATWSRKESCFFGNLFAGEGIYIGNDRGNLSSRESTARACTLSSTSGSTHTDCPPLLYAGSCTTWCTLDASKTYYTSCTYNGTTYQPITTRLREEDVYFCGDGTCQMTESCGTSNQYDNCQLDCGTCG